MAVDLVEMKPIGGVHFVCGDFRDGAVVDAVVRGVVGVGGGDGAGAGVVDVVVSDMAPNLSGVAVADQARAAELAQAAMDFAGRVLKPGGALVVKCFAGGEFGALRARARGEFAKTAVFRPPATRAKSREAYLIARGFLQKRQKPG